MSKPTTKHCRILRLILKGIATVCEEMEGGKKVSLNIGVGLVKPKTKQRRPMKIKITNEQEVTVTLSPRTQAGIPALLDGKPSWGVISGSSTVTPSEDGLSAVFRSSDTPGNTQVLVKADADLGEGVQEVSEIIDLEVSGALAESLGLTVSEPRTKS